MKHATRRSYAARIDKGVEYLVPARNSNARTGGYWANGCRTAARKPPARRWSRNT